MSDRNSGKEWSEMDLADLLNERCLNTPIEEMASFLMRDVAEVEAKLREIEAAK